MTTNGHRETKLTLTQLAARRIRQIATADLPEEVYRKASFCLIDYLGAVHSGLLLPWKDALLKYARLNSGKPEAYAWGLNDDVSAETAAFVNATLAHSAIRDDMHLEACSHIGSIVISAVLALAQRQKWSGEKILRAIIAGYEMAGVLGTAIRSQGTFNAHFRPSGLIGAFGATAAAIAAEGVDESVAVNALGFAISMSAGLNEWAWSGGMEIFVEMGVASRSGIASFDLASVGFESSVTALEGKDGLLVAVNAGEGAAHTFREWLDQSPIGKGIMDVHFKPVAGCNYAQTTSAVAVRIYQKHKPAEIDQIKITATSQAVKYPGCNNTGPLNSIQNTKMSIQFGVCAALVHGKLDEDMFKQGHDDKINKLIAKCELGSSTEYDKMYQRGMQPASVEVTLADGKVLSESADDVPWLGEDVVEARSLSEQARDRPETGVKKLIDLCKKLKDVGPGDNLLTALKY